MSVLFFKSIRQAKSDILELSNLVMERLHQSVTAVINRDASLARSIINSDTEIDNKEVDIEEELLKIMALNQPVAIDLRFLVAMLKINNDLERIGDLAVNIAERALVLNRKTQGEAPVEVAQMSRAVEKMVRSSIDSLINLDNRTAAAVCKEDDKIDRMQNDIDEIIKRQLAAETNKEQIDALVALIRVTRDLERIADHATNIAEDLIYMTDGQIIRHHAEEYVRSHTD